MKRALILVGLMTVSMNVGASVGTEKNNEFTIRLYKEAAKASDKNLMLSPLSVRAAVGMATLGAKGITRTELEKALEVSGGLADFDSFSGWLKDLGQYPEEASKKAPKYMKEAGGDFPVLRIANALWADSHAPLKPDFVKQCQALFDAGLRSIDFSKTEDARVTINKWVDSKTNEKIKDILPKGILDPLTKLVLTNAIYFKASWEEEFSESATKVQTFKGAHGKQQVPFMTHMDASYKLAETPDLTALEIPYLGGRFGFLVLLPKSATGLAKLERDLSSSRLSTLVASLKHGSVLATIPKFKFESEFELVPLFKALGVRSAFSYQADFSLMSDLKEFQIGAIRHKTFIDVNEKGTEAAAATAVMMRVAGLHMEPKKFVADHPFLFFIRDMETGGILFVGRLTDL